MKNKDYSEINNEDFMKGNIYTEYFDESKKTKKKSIIGTVNKTYDEHVKVVIVQLRDKMWRISANDNDDSIESNIAQMRQEIMTEALVREIEEI